LLIRNGFLALAVALNTLDLQLVKSADSTGKRGQPQDASLV
jgi:hypothetical protein